MTKLFFPSIVDIGLILTPLFFFAPLSCSADGFTSIFFSVLLSQSDANLFSYALMQRACIGLSLPPPMGTYCSSIAIGFLPS